MKLGMSQAKTIDFTASDGPAKHRILVEHPLKFHVSDADPPRTPVAQIHGSGWYLRG